MTPEQQLATTEANIKRWQKRVAEAGTEEAKKGATDGLIGQLKERDRLHADMASKADERQKKEESLMTRDRDLKEMGMTADQRMSESKKRTAELTKELNAETDPDKQLAIKSKLMDEAEKQQSMAKKADSERSMSIGDVFEKGYGQSRRKDPAHEQVDISKEIRDLLKKIETKKGGMAP
jgi:thymidylate synthase